jgi:hypothetical protein
MIRLAKEKIKWAGHVARREERKNTYRPLVGKPERKRPVGRPRRRWVDDIKMYLREIVWSGMDCIGLTQDRDSWRALVSAEMNLRVQYNAGNFISNCTTNDILRRA